MESKFSTHLKKAYARRGEDTGRGFPLFLSQRFGVTTQAAREWLKDKNYPRIEILIAMAADLGITVDQLLTGEGGQVRVGLLPLLASLSDAAKMDTKQTPDAQGIAVEAWIPSLRPQESKVRMKTPRVAVKQTGDTMIATGISFPEGMMLVFDITRRHPDSGDFVAATLGDGSATFRRFIQEGGMEYLMPINRAYENYRGEFKVFGTLDYAVLDF